MKLLLTSAGITNESLKKALLDLVGKEVSKTKIAIVPTASNMEEGDKDWLINDYQNLKKIGLNAVKTKGSLYLWVKIPDSFNNSQEFSFDLLEKKQILLTPGTAFGKNGLRYVRVSISSNIDNIDSYFN